MNDGILNILLIGALILGVCMVIGGNKNNGGLLGFLG